MDRIVIKGAKEHNLKDLDLEIPRDRLVVITGLSGSGKSSLAFDTIYAEGQRRYVESLSAYARQFLEQMEKPDVESIEGLSPAIAIEQKTTSRNPRSTIGTVTEIYDYLRLLYARIGRPHCYQCGEEISSQTVDQIVQRILELAVGTRITVMAPIVRGRKGEYRKELEQLRREGYVRVRIDGEIHLLEDRIALDKKRKHTIEVVVDRLVIKENLRKRLADSVETAATLAGGIIGLEWKDDAGEHERMFSQQFACIRCGISYPELTPQMFSFNSPHGACPECDGLGTRRHFDPDLVVPNPDLSLAEGAIAPWHKRHGGFYRGILESVVRHYKADVKTPFRKLPKKLQKVLLDGSGATAIEFVLESEKSRYSFKKPFDGVLANLDRRMRETTSENVREELSEFMSVRPCRACEGARVRLEARHVRLGGEPIHHVTAKSIGEAERWFAALDLLPVEHQIADLVLREIRERLSFLVKVGLDYLSLDRSAATLSGGEAQRIRLATQIGSSLVGVLYVLDEPSIGLHHRDNARLLEALMRLRDIGNTVIVVEHDRDTILRADHVIDMGPGAGERGGEIVAEGTPAEILAAPRSLTGRYLTGALEIPLPKHRREPGERRIAIRGARGNNLRAIDVEIPLGLFTCVTGVSGSGKSTLVIDTLLPALSRALYRSKERPDAHDAIEGIEELDKVIHIDQSPIGRTPRSNPATYTGLFTHIRDLFARLPEANVRGYGPGRFSFNVKGGRCEACQGDGVLKIEMHFLPDVYVTCDVCGGRRYNRETLEVRFKGASIADVLDMTAQEALAHLGDVPPIRQKLETLCDVGLGYIRLGQSATTLSGGEAQRIKLARELSKTSTGKTLYVLDEPTTGLHFADIQKLIEVLQRLAASGNTIVVIEHNLDVIKVADWLIDLGPEGGTAGGEVVVVGSPEAVAKHKASHTGAALREVLGARK